MDLFEFLENNNIEFKLSEPLSNHTNFKIGGKAYVMAFPSSISKFIRLLKFVKTYKIKFFVLGNGTNMLCSDNGFNGLIIKLGKNLKGYKISQNLVYAEAGVNLFEFNRILAKNGLSNLEFTYGIPGSVGGAVYMNAGAFNKSIGDYIKQVKVFDGERIRTLNQHELNFKYRHSTFQEKNYIILGASFNLNIDNPENITNLMNSYLTHRKETQPYFESSAGSVFKRLDGGEKPVSKMIDDLGLKGKHINDAYVSTIHAGFIVNKGKATCKDVLNLIEYIKEKVSSRFGVTPNLEIKILGEEDGITW